MRIFTEQVLRDSTEFKEWTKGKKVAVIHNCYYDDGTDYAAYIVLLEELGKWTITRFWEGGLDDKIQVSIDHEQISTIEVFERLLGSYSSGLK